MPPKAARKRKASGPQTRSASKNKKAKPKSGGDLEAEAFARHVEDEEAKAIANAKADRDGDSDEDHPVKIRRCSKCRAEFACEVGIKGKVQCHDCHAAAIAAAYEEEKEKKHDAETEEYIQSTEDEEAEEERERDAIAEAEGDDEEEEADDDDYEEESRRYHELQKHSAYAGAGEAFRKEKEERDARLIKKHARDKRACPFVVLDQVMLSPAGHHMFDGLPGIDEKTVFEVKSIEPAYGFPVAKWNFRVKRLGGDDATPMYPISWFELFARHNDIHRYKQTAPS